MDGPNVEYSRYKGEEDDRGESMVERHIKAQRENKKEQCLATLKAAWPMLKENVIVTALMDTNWDADKAFKALSMFMLTKKGGINKGKSEKKDKKDKKDKKEKGKDKKRKRSKKEESSASESDDDSGDSESDSDSGAERKHNKHKKEKHKKKKDKKHTKHTKDDKTAPKMEGAVTEQFGTYGVIKEADMWDKRPEFILWSTEIKNLDPELLSKWEEKELFREYMEDYNTATLPNKKYYNYELFLMQEKAKAQKGKGPILDEKTTFNDEEERKREMLYNRNIQKNQEVDQLRRTMVKSGVAADMREQEQLKQQMALAYKTGNVELARDIALRLAPDP